MNIFKETWSLVKMLFSDIKKTDEIKTLPMTHIPFKGYKYMMWCGKCIYRDEFPQFAVMNSVDKNHETIHLYQAKDKGSWTKYYLSYIWSWFCGNPFSKSAYYTTKYEIEAYAKQEDLKYLDRRTKDAVEDFKIKPRRKTFNQFMTTYAFKVYITNLFKDL